MKGVLLLLLLLISWDLLLVAVGAKSHAFVWMDGQGGTKVNIFLRANCQSSPLSVKNA